MFNGGHRGSRKSSQENKWQLLGGADKYKLEQWTGSQLVGVEGSPVPAYGATCVKVQIGDLCVNIDFLVVDSLKVESLIGIDFLEKHDCVVNLEEGVLQLKGTQEASTKTEWHLHH